MHTGRTHRTPSLLERAVVARCTRGDPRGATGEGWACMRSTVNQANRGAVEPR